MPINMVWLPFNQKQIDSVPEIAGVYKFGNRYSDGVVRTIYIGKAGGSNTLNGRISQHHLESEPNLSIKKYAQFFRYEVISDCESREKELLREFILLNGKLPLCNTQLPQG